MTGVSLPKIGFVTLGCPKNEVDSDRMKALVLRAGLTVADDPADADIIVLNTCGFIRDAVEEGVEVAFDLVQWRDESPGRRLVIAGCMVSRYGAELQASLTEADAFVSVADEPRIAQLLLAIAGIGPDDPSAPMAPSDQTPARTAVEAPSAYLQISDGCFRSCAYCTIPAIRGPYRSRPLPELLDEARFLVASGARELVLIGQDTSAWGRDLPGTETLADVVRAIARVEGLSWLRIMYVQPDGVTDKLLSVMAEEPTVCAYLDIPLQHASRDVLRAMRRSGSAEEFLGMLDRIRSHLPDIALRTSLIAGFPGENDSDVRQLLAFIDAAGFEYVGVFPYSPEAGTEAASMPGLPAKRTRVSRAQRLRDAADAVGIAHAEALVGKELEVLVEGVDEEGVTVGRWRGQAPEVDGVVLLDRDLEAGSLVMARVVDSLGYDLVAEVL